MSDSARGMRVERRERRGAVEVAQGARKVKEMGELKHGRGVSWKGKYFIIEKLRLKCERFSLYALPSYKSESSSTHVGRIEGDKRIYYEQVPLFVDAYVRV